MPRGCLRGSCKESKHRPPKRFLFWTPPMEGMKLRMSHDQRVIFSFSFLCNCQMKGVLKREKRRNQRADSVSILHAPLARARGWVKDEVRIKFEIDFFFNRTGLSETKSNQKVVEPAKDAITWWEHGLRLHLVGHNPGSKIKSAYPYISLS